MLKSSEKTSASAAQPPAGARRGARRAGTENFHQHQGGPAVEGKMMSYFAKEVQLTKKHEEILAQRLLLLQEMENDHGNQKTGKKTSHVKAAKLAQKRNRSLLQDIRTLEKRFEKEAHSRPPPELTNLQILYWALVEKQAPKWEQALLGRARRPAGARSWNQAGNDLQETPE
ncbi:uncharacterized protein C3orf14 homolog isoform X2 [Monodelphis domestica]|uniref:Chromosome 6 open reading frame, human C3orf14 n=2 Tax=Monodelphis domestica TaxID=13616 RepID=F6QEL2_MONDO|nr:uncharacterized protein C3orf14 homolog isoform X2 [Monodelphis domestica]